MSNFGDHLILQLIKEGQIEGYRALFARYYKPLCMQAYLLLKNNEDAEDVVQSTFIYLWNNKKFENIETSLSAYLGTSVRHACLSHLRKSRREQEGMDDYLTLNASSDHHDVEYMDEVFKKMEGEIEQLPTQCKQIFQLVYFEKKSYQEAADVLGVSINTVKTQLKIAMSRLREAMKGQ
ncbi:RNA polymerase sigma factor [Pinibacter soli]|uniref:RNA polymerase sigma-70 factor n=1 Tax=Pinibacter soli TaxID=3044211 RepID=A0ABT6RJC6_9BACT|nr:RNA polymerase sigma-70 factor [Pinibacter soli]MDI3322672.1 RNA polymerase sigma-70 factor [Pinibacter soli]